MNFEFGLDRITDYTQKRQAFDDIMAFAFHGLAFFFSALFSESDLHMNEVEGEQDDVWYQDLVVGMAGVTSGINSLIQGAVDIFNLPFTLIGLPPLISIPPILLPDLRVGDYVDRPVHWRGRHDSRVGVESTLTAANAYGRIFIPLFEMLNIPRELIEYSEVEFNQTMEALQNNAARDEIARTLTRGLFDPLLNWLAPMDDALVPLSLGYRPLGKMLDILPNLAFVTEHNIIPSLVDQVLNDLRLSVTLHLGGASGDSLNGLTEILADYLQFELFEMNFFLALFVAVLPDLLGAGPLLETILGAAGVGMAWVFAIPMLEIVQLPAGSFTGVFLNRNDGNNNECDFVTILEGRASNIPGPGVRDATLATIAGFFGGDAAANSFSFNLFGETGLPLGRMMDDTQPILSYLHNQTGIDFTGDFNTLLNGMTSLLQANEVPDFEPSEQVLELIDGIAQNSGHAIAWLVELFNPQNYPVRSFMNYALLDQARSRDPVINPVAYSRIWPRRKAECFIYRLPIFLDNFAEFFYESTFLEIFYDRLEEAWDLDMRGFSANREDFTENLIERFAPYGPLLRILLIGGRESETPWFGEQYANNGVPFDPTNTAAYTVGRAGDNLTFLNDFIGFSGYDGYRHGVIPILEAFGVPQRDILTHEEFVRAATDDETLLRLLIEPLLDVLDRVIADPIHELPQVAANIIYFLTAEGGNANMLLEGSAQNGFVEAFNRILRPLFAIADTITPMATHSDVFELFGIEYPFQLSIGGMFQEVWLTPDISGNSIAAGLTRRWFTGASDERGLALSLELYDMMELLSGTLVVYRSVNGQNDAVRLEIDEADLLTHVARTLLPLVFSEDNWEEMRLYIAARVPANTRGAVLFLLDALMDMVRGLDDDQAADLILAVMFHLMVGADCMLGKLFAMREFRARLIAFFERLADNCDLGMLAAIAATTLLLAGTAAAVPPIFAGFAGFLGVSAVVLCTILGRLCRRDCCQQDSSEEQNACREEPTDDPNNYELRITNYEFIMPPPTGDSTFIAILAAAAGLLSLAGAFILKKKKVRA